MASRDHPRIRGEKGLVLHRTGSGQGSPPHTRGKVVSDGTGIGRHRITPAYAGKRPSANIRECVTRDHPRIRGEKILHRFLCQLRLGSPPHTRGKESISSVLKSLSGITPAYAGKRVVSREAARLAGDHPRIRGEKSFDLIISADTLWITPAYAGKSLFNHHRDAYAQDHPRIRGEKSADATAQKAVSGSPPHTRGKD